MCSLSSQAQQKKYSIPEKKESVLCLAVTDTSIICGTWGGRLAVHLFDSPKANKADSPVKDDVEGTAEEKETVQDAIARVKRNYPNSRMPH